MNNKELGTVENILYMLHDDGKYTELEAKILDICLILHAELGGGNNSAFTTQVISSSGTDTFSAIASAICSIKGPKYGGANFKAFQIFKDMEAKLSVWENEEQIKEYLRRAIKWEEFGRTELIYGSGHVVFNLSDPRTKIKKWQRSFHSVSIGKRSFVNQHSQAK